jgi:hypothetical protein
MEKSIQLDILSGNGGLEMDANGNEIPGQHGAKQKIEAQVATGLKDPEQGGKEILALPMHLEFNAAVKEMGSDDYAGSVAVEEKLSDRDKDGNYTYAPHVVGAERDQLTFAAKRYANMAQADASNKYAVMKAMGQPIDPNSVMDDLKKHLITPAQAKAYTMVEGRIDADGYARMQTTLDHFSEERDNYSPHEYEAKVAEEMGRMQPNLTKEMQATLNEHFKQVLDPKDAVNSEDFKAVVTANDALYSGGGYGKFEYTHTPSDDELQADPDARPEKRIIPSVLQSANINKQTEMTQMRAWVANNPEKAKDGGLMMKQWALLSSDSRSSLGAGIFQPIQITSPHP